MGQMAFLQRCYQNRELFDFVQIILDNTRILFILGLILNINPVGCL
jgi:hypothetical protein